MTVFLPSRVLWCSLVVAQASAPVPVTLPTLGTWALLALALILGLVAMRRMP